MVQRLTTTEETVTAFKNGDIIIYPTDTVWGVGCTLSQTTAMKRLYELKQREAKPFTVLVSSLKMAKRYGEFNKMALKLANHFWPGALTLVLPVNNVLFEHLSATHGYFTTHGEELTTIAVRVPNNPWLIEVIDDLGEALTGPSANFAGNQPPIGLSNLDVSFADQVDAIVDRQDTGNGTSSTIVDTTGTHPQILRDGAIAVGQIMLVAK